jgi:alpha-tubulin suppressor-like RCC1 family protein
MPNGVPYCTGFKTTWSAPINNNTISSPVQTVSGGNNWLNAYPDIETISTGTCATAAIKTDGTLWLWGRDDDGRLGTNSTTVAIKSSPVQTVSSGTNWKQVSVGSNHVASVKNDGTLWLWGSGTFGIIGNNLTINQSSPVQTVSSGTNWKQVALALENSAAIKTDGTLWLWGRGDNGGTLGTNSTISSSSPVQTISTGNNWKQVSLSLSLAAAAIKTDGTLWLWGSGSLGVLGNNSTISRSSPVQTVSTGTNWKQVDLGSSHTASVKTDGTLWLWGFGNAHRLGNYSISNRSSPVQTALTGTDWKQASAGAQSTAAIKTNGTLWLWGDGGTGRLGNNCAITQSSPVQTVSTGTNWKQVCTGSFNFVSSIKTDGTLWSWGGGSSGVLGNSAVTDLSSPVQTVSTGTNWTEVYEDLLSVGFDHSFAIKNDGTLWLWGNNNDGQLGNSSTVDLSSPVQTVSTGTDWKQVSAGISHTSSIKTDGTLWLWGAGSNGGLGNNLLLSRSSPVQTVSTGTNWRQTSSGCNYTAATKTDGTLWLWGRNQKGQLGNETTSQTPSPVQTVSTGTNWKQVSSFGETTAATKTDGTLWLWGDNVNGQLGSNSTLNVSSPVQTVSTGTNWKQVSVNINNSAAIKNDGTLWLWGLGSAGVLGNNSTISHSSPVQTTSTGTNWKQVSAGATHVASVKTDGTLWLWGCDICNQLGDTLKLNQSSPVQTVTSGTEWYQAAAGGNHTLALKNSEELFVFGDNKQGQLACDRYIYTSTIDDLGVQLVEKDYLIDVYSNLVPWMKSPALWGWGCGALGRLGNNLTTNQSSPVQTISFGTNWNQVSAGNPHTAAIKTDGTLWLWGLSSNGRLGNNDQVTDHSSPVQTVSTGNNWKQVEICASSASVKTDGTLWLWGDNEMGQLGNSSTINRSSPVQTVSTGTNWKQVSLGFQHSASIKTDGTLWLWGCSSFGELGNNLRTNRSSPVQTTTTGTNWKQVSLGTNHSAATKTDGTLWLWGAGDSGRLGTDSTTNRSTPVQTVSSGTNWKQVSLGCLMSTAIKTDGTLWLWGVATNGVLGNNSTINRSSPVQTVTSGTNWKQVSTKGISVSSIKTDGTLWLWGGGGSGELGNDSTTNRSSPVQTISGGTYWKQVSSGCLHTFAIREDNDW